MPAKMRALLCLNLACPYDRMPGFRYCAECSGTGREFRDSWVKAGIVPELPEDKLMSNENSMLAWKLFNIWAMDRPYIWSNLSYNEKRAWYTLADYAKANWNAK